MDKEDNNYVEGLHGKYSGFGYHSSSSTFDDRHEHEAPNGNNNQIVDYMLNNLSQSTQASPGLSFADVMQLADLGPKLGLNHTKLATEGDGHVDHGTGIVDPIDFLKFPVLNDKIQMVDHRHDQSLMVFKPQEEESGDVSKDIIRVSDEKVGKCHDNETKKSSMHQILAIHGDIPSQSPTGETKGKRKRPRTIKTSQEVESQRMTHIAVERNRRKQMNEHLRVLRSLMPGSYVQRGDQASIIGGAIEFVRELEQLLQCLESQKRRRLYGDLPSQPGDPSSSSPGQALAVVGAQQTLPQLIFPNNHDQLRLMELEAAGIQEEMAESKSCLADVEVKMLGFDAMIKILSRRRPGQLTKAIEALEEHLQMNILHTNITTMEQTVLYSFNVKVGSEAMFTAEDIANSVQQIFGFIHANTLEVLHP
ncbi:transcription factor FAMA-like [Impatiens glandulifera]|uniref:transcription factor FAMA-like n=1 Tax=Impatiens glandulifera TaxID=253017 RepID=UPI001FB0E79B|nr:transcription factor FAMA-like [Impatiens glandulifera]